MQHEKSPKEQGQFRQFFVAVVANISTLTAGIIMGWQSPFGPQLQSSSPPVGSEPMTDNGIFWLSGTLGLAGFFWTVMLSIIPDRFSRKRFSYLLALLLSLSWLLIIFATDHIYIYVARIFSGLSGASVFFHVPIYVSEIASDSIRGMLGSILVFSLSFGILLAYILGGILSLRVFAIVSFALSAFYFVAFTFMPESPVYLVRQNRMQEASRSMTWLKGGDSLLAERELTRLQIEVKKTDSSTESKVKLMDLFKDKASIKGLIISFGLFGGQQFSGIFVMINYTETIFKMSGSSLSPNTAAIIVGAIQFFGSSLSTSLMERVGRRPLLLVSCAGMCVCLCGMGTFIYLQEFNDISAYGWLPVVMLSIYMIVYALGMGSGPIVVTSEIFSLKMSSLGMGISLSFLWFVMFFVLIIFSNLIALLGMHGCFFFFGASCASSFLFYFMLLPETKGRVREDIVDELNGPWCGTSKKNMKNIIGVHSAHVDSV